MITNWDRKFLRLAEHVAGWSKDPSTKTGAVIAETKTNILVSIGYNGFARGVDDSPERYANRDIKYPQIVHCERNAIIFARRDVSNCTLYTWPFMSCETCAGMVINAGIKRVVAPYSENPRWTDSFAKTQEQFDQAIVELILMRD